MCVFRYKQELPSGTIQWEEIGTYPLKCIPTKMWFVKHWNKFTLKYTKILFFYNYFYPFSQWSVFNHFWINDLLWIWLLNPSHVMGGLRVPQKHLISYFETVNEWIERKCIKRNELNNIERNKQMEKTLNVLGIKWTKQIIPMN